MTRWPLIFALLLASPAVAQEVESQNVYWMTIADPQMDQRCDYEGTRAGVYAPGDPQYEACSAANRARVAAAFAIAKRLHDRLPDFFVWVLGDHTQNGSERQKRIMRELIEPYPELELHFAAGNHDADSSTCSRLRAFWRNAFDQDPRACGGGRYGTGQAAGDCSRPEWEMWSRHGYYFITLDSNLWAGRVGVACDDPERGPFTAEAQAQKAFLSQSVTTALADAKLAHIVTASHHEVFRNDPDAPSTGHASAYVYLDVSWCQGGASPAHTRCSADADCQGPDTCQPDPTRQYRQHWLDESARVHAATGACKMIWHLSGHGHQERAWDPTLAGCTYQLHETMSLANSASPSAASVASLRTVNRHSVDLWTGYPDGRILRQRIAVEPGSRAGSDPKAGSEPEIIEEEVYP